MTRRMALASGTRLGPYEICAAPSHPNVLALEALFTTRRGMPVLRKGRGDCQGKQKRNLETNLKTNPRTGLKTGCLRPPGKLQ